MKYFESFPKTLYTFNKNTINVNAVTNILARTTFLRDVADNVDLSYEYLIRDEDTPDIIAHKAYGDPYRSWIILLFNNILNPNYDWPLKSDALDSYIANKYSMTVQESKDTIHHYEKEVTTTSTYQDLVVNTTVDVTQIGEYSVNFRSNLLLPQTLPTTADTSLVISTETSSFENYLLTIVTRNKAVSIYTFEFEENEKKRAIRILDPQYVARVEAEFRDLMANG